MPPVLLIDEFSSGVDAQMKREMWSVLREVAVDKGVLIATRMFPPLRYPFVTLTFPLDSMEEAAALANKVSILSKRMLGGLAYY